MKSLQEYINENTDEPGFDGIYSVETAHELFDEYFRNFDIESIPIEVRRAAIKDYEEIDNEHWEASWECMAGLERIEEALSDDIAATRNVINKLRKKYGMKSYQFRAFHPNDVQIVKVDKIPNYMATSNSILVADVENNVEIIKKEMKLVNYYLVREYSYHDRKLNCDWTVLMFDPIHQDDISTQIRNNFATLYHFTPIANHELIVRNGIVPRNEKRIYTYHENRVYLLTVNYREEDFKTMLDNISRNRKRMDKNFDGKFMIYQIEVDQLPADMKFYYDPHGTNCIYTTTTIPFAAVSHTKEIQVE